MGVDSRCRVIPSAVPKEKILNEPRARTFRERSWRKHRRGCPCVE